MVSTVTTLFENAGALISDAKGRHPSAGMWRRSAGEVRERLEQDAAVRELAERYDGEYEPDLGARAILLVNSDHMAGDSADSVVVSMDRWLANHQRAALAQRDLPPAA